MSIWSLPTAFICCDPSTKVPAGIPPDHLLRFTTKSCFLCFAYKKPCSLAIASTHRKQHSERFYFEVQNSRWIRRMGNLEDGPEGVPDRGAGLEELVGLADGAKARRVDP